MAPVPHVIPNVDQKSEPHLQRLAAFWGVTGNLQGQSASKEIMKLKMMKKKKKEKKMMPSLRWVHRLLLSTYLLSFPREQPGHLAGCKSQWRCHMETPARRAERSMCLGCRLPLLKIHVEACLFWSWCESFCLSVGLKDCPAVLTEESSEWFQNKFSS